MIFATMCLLISNDTWDFNYLSSQKMRDASVFSSLTLETRRVVSLQLQFKRDRVKNSFLMYDEVFLADIERQEMARSVE
jgi:hypothetical protein